MQTVNSEYVHEHTKHAIVSPLFQIVCSVITSCLFGYMLYSRIHFWNGNDVVPKIESVNPKMYAMFGGFAQTVQVGLHIEDIIALDVINNNFIISGNVSFMFISNLVSINMLGGFSFARAELLEKMAPIIQVQHNHMFVQYPIRVKFKTPLNLKDFPFDNHSIVLELNHLVFSPSELMFEPEMQFFSVREKSAFGWHIMNKQMNFGYREIVLMGKNSYYPTVIFIINIMRSGMQYPLTLFLPLLMIFFIMLFAFSIKQEETRITLTASSVTGILAYRFVIANLSPQSGYFMLSDYFFFLFLGLSIIFFFVNSVEIFYHQFSTALKKLIVVIFHIAVNCSIAYLLHG